MKKLILMNLLTVTGIFTATAQKTDPDTAVMHGSLKEVIITAEKRNQLETEIPASVSLIRNQKIDDEQMQTLRDVTGIVPNLYMPEYGSRLTAPLFIRGIGARINNPSVGLYVDGVPYFEKSAFGFNLSNVERIEILRGPQGTLYGRNTMGGIVNVITKAPGYIRRTNLDVDFGNYSFQQYRLTHNQPIISRKMAVLVNAGYMDHGGYYTNKLYNQSVGTDNTKDASLRFRFQPNSELTFDYKIGGEKSKERAYPYGVIDSANNVNVAYNHKSFYKRDLLDNSLSVLWKRGNLAVISVTSYQYLKDNQDADYDYLPLDWYYSNQNSKENLMTQEFTLSGNAGDFVFTGGLFGFTQKTDRDYAFRYGNDITAVPVYQRAFPNEYDQSNVEKNYGAAVYGEITYSLLNFIDLTAGLRYDYEKNETSYSLANYLNTGKVFSPEVFYKTNLNKLLPKFAIRLKTSPLTSVYATYTTGYKIGGFNLAATNPRDRDYEPENSINYEVGFKGIIIPEVLSANISGFYIEWKDQQVANRIPTGYVYRNAGRSTTRGIESELTYRLLKNFILGGSFGLTIAKYEQYQDTVRGQTTRVVSYNGNYLPYIPRYTYTGYGYYKLILSSENFRSLDFYASLTGLGKHYWDDANTHGQLPYSIVNANISLQTRWAKISLWGKNILKQKYHAYSFTYPGPPIWWAQEGLPETYGLALSVSL